MRRYRAKTLFSGSLACLLVFGIAQPAGGAITGVPVAGKGGPVHGFHAPKVHRGPVTLVRPAGRGAPQQPSNLQASQRPPSVPAMAAAMAPQQLPLTAPTSNGQLSWHDVPSSGGVAIAAASGTQDETIAASYKVSTSGGLRHPEFEVDRAGPHARARAVSVRIPVSLLDGEYGANYASRVRWSIKSATSRPGSQGNLLSERRVGDNVVVNATLLPGVNRLIAMSSPVSSTGEGNFGASAIRSTATWNVGEQTGDFTWSYPMKAPPQAAGPAPATALSYDSQSIDGETGSTNNQSSSVGDGWALSGGGAVTRSYVPCSLNQGGAGQIATSGDLCWGTANATVNFAGHSGELIQGTDGSWHLKGDDGTRIQYLTGSTNGTYDGDYWVLTTTDGTQYYFGVNNLLAWGGASAPKTQSAYTVPVYGANAGDPCHGTTFAKSECLQAWQWNLDFVIDTNNNAEALYYAPQTNTYAMDGGPPITYIRSGNLSEIDYGLRAGTPFTATSASDRILFTYAARCETGMPGEPAGACNLASPTATYWPDTPLDQNCTTPTCTQITPSFWSSTMLTAVTTQILSQGAYANVDLWTLSHSWPSLGDGESPALWLTQLVHTGIQGTQTISEPPTIFNGASFNNRVWVTNGLAPMAKFRINSIDSSTGGVITVSYGGANGPAPCTQATVQSLQPEVNANACYPQWWTPGAGVAATLDWFNLYVVTTVNVNPETGGPNDAVQETDYLYTGKPAWRFDNSPGTIDSQRTWSTFAGFSSVEVREGNPGVPLGQTTTDYSFLQGLDGDAAGTPTAPTATKRSVTVTSTTGTVITDSPWWAGMTYETITRLGSSGGSSMSTTPVLSDEVTVPWASAATETKNYTYKYKDPASGVKYTGTLTFSSHLTGPGTETSTSPVSTGGNRTVIKTSSYDTYGRLWQMQQATSDAGTTCTATSFATNATSWLLDLPAQKSIVNVACNAVATYPANAVSTDATLYDGTTTIGQAPTVGNATEHEVVASYTGQTPVWQVTDTNTYDSLGRVLTSTDPRTTPARTTTTAYTPAASGPLLQKVVTNPLSWSTTTGYDPEWGVETSVTDPNNNLTTSTYDALGRTAEVWLPNQPQSLNPNAPSDSYTYSESTTGPNVVSTTAINAGGGTTTSFELYDGTGQVRQKQTPSDTGGIDIVDTYHDAAGRVDDISATYFATGTPSGTLLVPSVSIPSQTETTFDGAGRPAADILLTNGTPLGGTEAWRTSYVYIGADRVDETPPTGGIPTSTFTNSLDEKTSLTQWLSATPGVGTAETTTYGYDARESMTSMTDPAGNVTTWKFDVLGRESQKTDPNGGTSSTSYTPDGSIASTTDAKYNTLAYTYDLLDRKTSEYSGSLSGVEMSVWTYDTTSAGLGKPATTVRYVGGTAGQPGSGTTYTTSIAGYTSLGSPTAQTVAIPGTSALSGAYTTSYTYAPDGSPLTQVDPAEGGLSAETLTKGYDSLGYINGLASEVANYANSVSYTNIGQVAEVFQFQRSEVWHDYTWDPGTSRLDELQTSYYAAANAIISDPHYSYDNAGNITEIADKASLATDTQCFTYDHLRNLTSAWTPSSGSCAAAPSSATLGGPAPYWQSYTVDPATGNRTSKTQYPTSATGSTTSSNYAYPPAKAAQPNTVGSITTTVTPVSGGGTSSTANYSYDPNGSTTARPGQTLAYDAENRLASTTNTATGQVQTNIYTADGSLLVQSDPTSGTTVYLGDTELHLPTGATSPGGTRTYTLLGQPIAERDSAAGVAGSTLYFLDYTPQGTAQAWIDTATTPITIAQRFLDPFGSSRGPAVSWPSAHTFLNAATDPFTGVIKMGARSYDPVQGRFLSLDPQLNTDDPQQTNGYSYADNNPVTNSDPSGLDPHRHHRQHHSQSSGNCWFGCWFSQAWHGAVHGLHGAAHFAVHVADNARHFVAEHRRGLAQIAIAVAAVTVTVATAGTATPILAAMAAGAATSLASYGAGCIGIHGSGGCTAKGAIIATATGAASAGLTSGANSLIGGSIGTSVISRFAQYSSIGVLSSAVTGSGGILADNAWEHQQTTGGQILQAGLGSLAGIADH